MLYMEKKDYDKILKYAVDGLPNEACGLIAGTADGEEKYVKEVYLLTNIDASSEHFSMDPREQFAAVKDARAKGYELLGNFHSHPNSPSRPSGEDKRLAYDAGANYLILSLEDREHPVLHAFLIDENKNVTENPIEII